MSVLLSISDQLVPPTKINQPKRRGSDQPGRGLALGAGAVSLLVECLLSMQGLIPDNLHQLGMEARGSVQGH